MSFFKKKFEKGFFLSFSLVFDVNSGILLIDRVPFFSIVLDRVDEFFKKKLFEN